MKYYVPFHSLTGTTYKAKAGTDGVTVDDMRGLRRIVKNSRKQMDYTSGAAQSGGDESNP